jgi:hypothetical protein
MPERIVTDEKGDRWDVLQREGNELTFRHQGGRELRVESTAPLDSISSDRLLGLLADAREAEGESGIGERRGRQAPLDPEGYTTN